MIKTKTKPETNGVISPGETFTQRAFCDRIGCTRQTLATWKKNGLNTVKIGGKIFIRAIDFSIFLDKLAKPAESSVPETQSTP